MYVIQAPSTLYNGTTYGVRFDNGIGTTEDKAIRDVLVDDFKYTEAATADKPKGKKVTPAAESAE